MFTSAEYVLLYDSGIHAEHESIVCFFKTFFQENNMKCTFLDSKRTQPGHVYMRKIELLDPDFLVTLDLAGFWFKTQAGEVALNNLYCKQIHFLIKETGEYPLFLNKKLSISMFFYQMYPGNSWEDLPYLKKISGWNPMYGVPAAAEGNKCLIHTALADAWKETR